ncbi:hypothetical protein GCM10022405_05200 [Gibbsiella dentisursi]|uniref:Uncharacterized protein n=1 Tax=Gibbsiella dentisursi TaxID=796890 RepID=A0ABP7KMF5_9GAMM
MFSPPINKRTHPALYNEDYSADCKESEWLLRGGAKNARNVRREGGIKGTVMPKIGGAAERLFVLCGLAGFFA